MVSLREVRKRISSVHNIKQITKAMELVAGTQLHRVERRLFQSRLYFIKLHQILTKLALSTNDFMHPLLEKRSGGKIGVMVITSEKGLCGSYNSNLFSAAELFLEPYSPVDVELLVLGKKGATYYRNRKWKIKRQLTEWSSLDISAVHELAAELVEEYLSRQFDALWVVYARFVSLFSRQVVVEKFLNIEAQKLEWDSQVHPLSHEKTAVQIAFPPLDLSIQLEPAAKGEAREEEKWSEAEYTVSQNPILEPDIEGVYKALLPRWAAAKMQHFFDEAYASELAARVVSMKTATKNAEEMIESLTLLRNKVRQENITKEIIEIASGAESLK